MTRNKNQSHTAPPALISIDVTFDSFLNWSTAFFILFCLMGGSGAIFWQVMGAIVTALFFNWSVKQIIKLALKVIDKARA